VLNLDQYTDIKAICYNCNRNAIDSAYELEKAGWRFIMTTGRISIFGKPRSKKIAEEDLFTEDGLD